MREILESHTVPYLRSELRMAKADLKYGHLKKAGLVDLMLKHKELFSHIKMAEQKPKKEKVKKEKVKKEKPKKEEKKKKKKTAKKGKSVSFTTKDGKKVNFKTK